MKTNTAGKIIGYIRKRKSVRVYELTRFLGLSAVAVHKQVKNLVARGLLVKIGKPPLVFYQLSSVSLPAPEKEEINQKTKAVLKKTYLYISATGEMLSGAVGFQKWNLP